MVETIDKILLAQIQQDDQQALESLFQKYYFQLCGFAKIYVKRSDLSEEIVADVFFNLWQNRRRIEITRNFKAYLYVSIKNECLNALKKNDYMFEDIDQPEVQYKISEGTSTDFLEYEELERKISTIIEELPPQRKLIFKLNRLDGLKYKEIADILHISVHTVQKQMVEAVKYISRYESMFSSFQLALLIISLSYS